MKSLEIEVEAVETEYGHIVHLYQDNQQTVVALTPEQIDLVIQWLKIAKNECFENGGRA